MKLSTTLDRALKIRDLTTSEFANLIHLSKQATANYRTGYRHLSAQKAAEIQQQLQDYQFGDRAAAEFFGTLMERTTKDLSHPDDDFLIRDLRNDEQADREQLDDQAHRIFRIPYQERSLNQMKLSDQYLKEFAEEISAEILCFVADCREAQVDPYELVKEINSKNER